MKTIQVKKDSFGLKYKTDPGSAWKYFDDNVRDNKSMVEYFTNGRHNQTPGKFDPPNIQFINQAGKPVKHFTVSADRKTVIIDLDKPLSLDQTPGIYEDIKGYLTDDLIQMAERKNFPERIDYIRETVNQETRSILETLIEESNSDQGIENFCRNHSKKFFSLGAEIEFQK